MIKKMEGMKSGQERKSGVRVFQGDWHDHISQSLERSRFNNSQVGLGEKITKKPGGETILSSEMEIALVQHLLVLSDWGFPFDTMDQRMTVKRILDKEGRTVKCFKDNLPGKKALIGDNLSSHFSNEILRECERNNISFVCLPPNATHLLQPLDVAYFGPMKTKWRSILAHYKASKQKNAGTIPKDVFTRLLKKLMLELPNQENIKAGFRKCGIYPLDKVPVLDRLPRESNEAANNSVSEVFTEHLRQLRHGDDGAPRKMRRKRLDVVPGRSIAASHDEAHGEESSASRAEPEAEEGACAVDDDATAEDEWTPATERNIFSSFQ
ncbi:tigger transposable element-derived protein 2 [Plakobranchus ocellatus]|uniref:Tigger transposable element-derived protein 2 n=1 Tax=Plakobranchus ocellatus TaxID=259542 RepID=A0AAV4AQD7_9GAST|nr:tigger transposable element-derived protein 2 [Plakobranchus ocellatus]